MRKAFTLLAFLWAFLAGGAALGTVLSEQEPPGDEVLRFAAEFRRAVLQRDMPYLEKLLREGGGIDDEVLRFVYEDEYAKRYLGPRAKSVATILSGRSLAVVYEGAIDNSREEYKGTGYIIYFYTYTAADRKSSYERIPYLVRRKKWMVDYVACRFERRGTEWLMNGSFCFNETEGPGLR